MGRVKQQKAYVEQLSPLFFGLFRQSACQARNDLYLPQIGEVLDQITKIEHRHEAHHAGGHGRVPSA